MTTQCYLLRELAKYLEISDPSASSDNLDRKSSDNPCGIPWIKDRIIANPSELDIPKADANDMSFEEVSSEPSSVAPEKILILYDYAHKEALRKTINIAGKSFELIGGVASSSREIEAFARSKGSGERQGKYVRFFKGMTRTSSSSYFMPPNTELRFKRIEVQNAKYSEMSHFELFLEGLAGSLIHRTWISLYQEQRFSVPQFRVWPAFIDYDLITETMMPKFLQSLTNDPRYEDKVNTFKDELVSLIRAIQLLKASRFTILSKMMACKEF